MLSVRTLQLRSVDLPDHARASVISGILALAVALAAVLLRFVARSTTKARYGLDDVAILVALVALIPYQGITMRGAIVAGDGSVDVPDPKREGERLEPFLISLYASIPFFGIITSSVRASFILLYRRLFFPRFQRASLVILAIIFATWIAGTLASIFQCTPPQKFWQPWLEGHCVNFGQFFLAMECISTIQDAVMLCLPLPFIWGLSVPVRRRLAVAALFLLGGFIIVTGIVRIYLVYIPDSAYVSFSRTQLWSNIHDGTAILCACIPTYKPLFRKATQRLGWTRGTASSPSAASSGAASDPPITGVRGKGLDGEAKGGLQIYKTMQFQVSDGDSASEEGSPAGRRTPAGVEEGWLDGAQRCRSPAGR